MYTFQVGDKFVIEIKEITNDGYLFKGIPKKLHYHHLLNLPQVEEIDTTPLGIKQEGSRKKYREFTR